MSEKRQNSRCLLWRPAWDSTCDVHDRRRHRAACAHRRPCADRCDSTRAATTATTRCLTPVQSSGPRAVRDLSTASTTLPNVPTASDASSRHQRSPCYLLQSNTASHPWFYWQNPGFVKKNGFWDFYGFSVIKMSTAMQILFTPNKYKILQFYQ